jgi:two-component system, cell cycle sensor histidine kinase and response regulator CckA
VGGFFIFAFSSVWRGSGMIEVENLGILEALPNPIIVANRDETIVLVNGLAEELFSCEREKLLGRSVEELVSECSRSIYHAKFSELLQKPGRMKFDLYALTGDGREFPVEINFSPLMAGKNISILNAFRCYRDTTERKSGASAPAESDRRYYEMFENADDIMFTLDLAGGCTFLNKAGEQLLGYSFAEAMNMNILQVILPEHTDKAGEVFSRAAAGETVKTIEIETITKDGRRVPLEVSAKTIYQNGNSIGIQGIARDISERKLLQKQLLQAQKMEAVGRLAGGVAHDFNNILTIIGCYSDLLLGELRPGDPKFEYVEQIKGAGKKGSWLALQLLAFSRKQARSPKVLDINGVVSECSKMLGRVIGKDIRVETSLAPDIGMLKADPGQIEQILLNLAINAADAMPEGGQFIITTRNTELDESYVSSHVGAHCGSYVTLEVRDTGRGMGPETQMHIFEPFFTTKEEGKGTGLGLATVYGIVKQNNGYIWVESRPCRGTTFTIHLPRTREIICSDQPAESVALGGSETILVVEDEEPVRNILVRILHNSGYNALAAKTSEEALNLCRNYNHPIHLLITDFAIPGINGMELARLFSRWKPTTKVLFISGYTDDSITRYGTMDRETQLLQKPFQRDQLLTKVRSLLDRA